MKIQNITIVDGQTFKHYKGDHYVVVGIALHTEDVNHLVIYHLVNDTKLYARPKDMFLECLEDGTPRFSLV
jgi:hypothetical protein